MPRTETITRTETIIFEPNEADKEILERLDYSAEQIKTLTSALAAKEKIEWIKKNHTRATEKPYELTHDEIVRIISVREGQTHIQVLLKLFNDLKSKSFNKDQIITIAAQRSGSNNLSKISAYANVLLEKQFSHAQLTKLVSRSDSGGKNIETLHALYFKENEQTKKFEALQLSHEDIIDILMHEGHHSNITKLIKHHDALEAKEFVNGEKFTHEEIIAIAKTEYGGNKIETIVNSFNDFIKIAPTKTDVIDILNHARNANIIPKLIVLYEDQSRKFSDKDILAIVKTYNNIKKLAIIASEEQCKFLLNSVGLTRDQLVKLLECFYGDKYISDLIKSNACIKDGKIEIKFQLTRKNQRLITFFKEHNIEVLMVGTDTPVSLEKERKRAYQMFYSKLASAMAKGEKTFSIVNFPNILNPLNKKDSRAKIGVHKKIIKGVAHFEIINRKKAERWLNKNKQYNPDKQTAETQAMQPETTSIPRKRTANALDKPRKLEPQTKRKKNNPSSQESIVISTNNEEVLLDSIESNETNKLILQKVHEKLNRRFTQEYINIVVALAEAIESGKTDEYTFTLTLNKLPRTLYHADEKQIKERGFTISKKRKGNIYTICIKNREAAAKYLNRNQTKKILDTYEEYQDKTQSSTEAQLVTSNDNLDVSGSTQHSPPSSDDWQLPVFDPSDFFDNLEDSNPNMGTHPAAAPEVNPSISSQTDKPPTSPNFFNASSLLLSCGFFGQPSLTEAQNNTENTKKTGDMPSNPTQKL